jgi:hypothetical protein
LKCEELNLEIDKRFYILKNLILELEQGSFKFQKKVGTKTGGFIEK